jgi:hypothetical protein
LEIYLDLNCIPTTLFCSGAFGGYDLDFIQAIQGAIDFTTDYFSKKSNF